MVKQIYNNENEKVETTDQFIVRNSAKQKKIKISAVSNLLKIQGQVPS